MKPSGRFLAEAALFLVVAAACLIFGSAQIDPFVGRLVSELPHHARRMLGYAPPPNVPGPAYIGPSGNMTTNSGVQSPTCVLGEPVYGPVCVDAGANVLLASLPGIPAVGEGSLWDVSLQVVADGGTSVGAGNCTRRFHGSDVAGVFQTAGGSTSDTSITADWAGTLADAGCALIWDAGASGQLGSMGITLSTSPTSGGACVYYGVSYQRCLDPKWGPSLTVDRVTPASLGTTTSSSTTIYLQGTHDLQPASVSSVVLSNGSNSYTLTSPQACPGPTGPSSNCIQAVVPAATYAGGTYNVVATTAAGTFTLVSGWTFSSGTISSVSPSSGPNVLGSPYSVTLNTSTGAATGSCTASIGSTALTGCSPSGGNSIACSIPSGTYTAGAYTVSATCSGSGVLTPLVNGFTFATTPTLTATDFPVGVARGGATFHFTGTNFASGMTCNFGATSGVTTTITSSTQASCVIPSGTATGSAINFSVTLAGNTSGTKSFYYYPNSVIALYVPELSISGGFPAATQTVSQWNDLAQVGPYHLTQATGGNQLSITTTWLNGWPAYTNVSGTHYMTASIPSTSQPVGVSAVADATTATDSFTGFLWSGTSNGGRIDLLNDNGSSCGAGRRISFYAGGGNTACVNSTFNLSSPHAVGGVYDGNSNTTSIFYGDRSQIANGASGASSPGTNPLVGLTIFTRYDQASPWPGDLGEIEVLAGVSDATMLSDIQTLLQPIQKLNWGTP